MRVSKQWDWLKVVILNHFKKITSFSYDYQRQEKHLKLSLNQHYTASNPLPCLYLYVLEGNSILISVRALFSYKMAPETSKMWAGPSVCL